MIKKQEQGLVLVMVMVMVAALMIIGLSLISQSTSQYVLTNTAATSSNATYTAEAGVEQSIQALNADSSFAGYTSPQTFFDSASQGFGTYSTAVTPASGNTNAKVITSTAKIYKYKDHSTLLSTRIVQVTVVGTTAEGYSVMTGPGGLVLTGSGNITNSSVYVGGKITLTGAAKIGTVAKPLEVYAANKSCPSTGGASYPSLCTSSQPISLAQSTNIYGTVCATGQTSKGPNNNIQPGNGGQGLIVGCTAPDTSPPTYDRTSHIAAMTTTGSGSDNTYVCNSWPFDRTWPANLKLTGNVTIGSSCNLTIKGNVYITGNLTINGAAHVKVDNSVGTTRPVVVVDGTITVDGSASITTNSSGTGIEFISFASDPSTGCNASCTSITGQKLWETSDYVTIRVGGAVSVPGVIFHAYWGEVDIAGSGNIGSAIGQTVNLSGAGTVTFGTKLSSGVSTWTISSYQIKYPGQ